MAAGYDRTAPRDYGGPAITSQTASHAAAPQEAPSVSHQPEAARLGNPSFVWRFGQERRLAIIERHASLAGRRALDLGCGLGEYVRGFERLGADALGADIEWPRLVEARERGTKGLLAAAGETLPFRDAALDVVVLNEVIEHVADDQATMREVGRVLAPGGVCVIFAPNRLYPFETHGIYWRGTYRFGNYPFVNWLPRALRNRFVPHARVYGRGDWARVFEGSNLEVVSHGYVYPGFDNIVARWPLVGRVLRTLCYWAESSWFARFGLSHLIVLRRPESTIGGAA